MGITRFNGPVYGAKSLLFEAKQEVGIVSTATQTICQLVVPVYQDLYITELHAFRQSSGSTVLTVALSDDSSRATASSRTIATVAFASSLTNQNGSTTPAADQSAPAGGFGGEYEGVRVSGGSTLTLQFVQNLSSVAALTSSGVFAWAYGFMRYVDSTRGV